MVECLQWDSDFFGLRIGRTDIASNKRWYKLQQEVITLRKQYDLIYVFSDQELPTETNGMHLVDTKTIYAKSIDSSTIMPATIERYQESVPNDDLYRLALVSGVYSRFRLDNSLPSDSYERLFRCWIERSVDGAMADLVLVHYTDNQIDGMITMKIEADVAHIGLVSVDEGSQGRGVGTMLIRAVEAHLQSNTTVRHLKVATQWANKPACHLYEKNGFVVEEKTNIYHWWL
mgnify:FL=1